MNQEIDIRAEVNRKAIETLETIIRNHENGSVDPSSTKYALATLFGVTSGITSTEVFESISLASEEYGHIHGAPRTRLFLGESGLVTITLLRAEAAMMVRKFNKGEGMQLKEKRIAFRDSVMSSTALNKFESLCSSLIGRGYAEL